MKIITWPPLLFRQARGQKWGKNKYFHLQPRWAVFFFHLFQRHDCKANAHVRREGVTGRTIDSGMG